MSRPMPIHGPGSRIDREPLMKAGLEDAAYQELFAEEDGKGVQRPFEGGSGTYCEPRERCSMARSCSVLGPEPVG